MKKSDIFPTYKVLIQMRDLADKLDEAVKKEDLNKASQIKIKILELQRSLKKLL